MKKNSKIKEAKEIIIALGLPREQQNDRSALCLLALLNLTPNKKWAEAENPLMGITPIMDWARINYQKKYAPNTRETVRRQTMRQFVDAGIALYNPDDPDRPVNSPKAVYKIEPITLALLRTHGTPVWKMNLKAYLAQHKTLAQRYARERTLSRIPVQIAPKKKIHLTPGEHNELIKLIIEGFGSRFVPANRTIMSRYLGDIAWETEVWVADTPSHLIHFNGVRFLGPYKK